MHWLKKQRLKVLNLSMLNYGKIILIILLFISCSTEEEPLCELPVLNDRDRYMATKTESYTITEAKITGNCLEISLSASGCNGDSWEVELIDAGIKASRPELTRFLKVSLLNPELCYAIIHKTYSFRIGGLKENAAEELVLKLEAWDEDLRF